MSSLNVNTGPDGWRAFPSPDTTIGQITAAIFAFPDLRIQLGPELDVTLVIARLGATPPKTDELAQAMFGDSDRDLLVSEDTGSFEAFDREAGDRNAEGV